MNEACYAAANNQFLLNKEGHDIHADYMYRYVVYMAVDPEARRRNPTLRHRVTCTCS